MKRKKKYRRRKFSAFQRKLRRLGFKNYAQYLRSDHWKSVKQRYANSKQPKICACCGDPKYQLHHKTYERLGKEHLKDFLPLCDCCHRQFHRYLSSHKELKLTDTKIILKAIKDGRIN